MKSRIIVFLVFTTLSILSTFPVIAQDYGGDNNKEATFKIRPFRIGVKAGFPNLIGGNIEYVTPLFRNKLALNVDYSHIKSDWLLEPEDRGGNDQNQLKYIHGDFGLNYYFFKPGKGLYAGVSYSIINAEAEIERFDAVEYINEKHNSVNLKLGARLGGLFYFRPEVGYMFSSLPKKYEVLAVYDDGTRETRIDDWSDSNGPEDILFKGLIANIGIGFAF